MCHFKDMSVIKIRARLQNSVQGSRAGLVTLQQVYQCGMVFEADVDTDKSFQIGKRKIEVYVFIIRANTNVCDSRYIEISLTWPPYYFPILHALLLALWISESSCFIVSCITFSVFQKLVLQNYSIAKILRGKNVV